MTDKTLLHAEEDSFLQQLLLNSPGSGEMNLFPDQTEDKPQFTIVKPEPGVCVKTKDNKGEKIFVNICKTSQMPSPKDITEEELVQLLDDEVPDYRIPMSIGEPHAELDKSGKGCTAYDVMISDEFMAKIIKSNIFHGFFMSVLYEGLENKFGIMLERNWTQLKNRKCLGNLHEHHIRAKSKPRILEMSQEAAAAVDERQTKSLISELPSEVSSAALREADKTPEEPECVIIQEPKTGYPEFLVAEVKLPKVH
ncbi:PIH1 domain-containing protein 1-like isoform X2 [Apostichopus japonicus]|uniref:PIH1 domain-containing protein 1-like isoform X2 n=1 Tax=Stichopus japonicus TaxID=307972 RepID=UPI003AB19D89